MHKIKQFSLALFCGFCLVIAAGPAVSSDLNDIPFWELNEGTWVSENTYLAPGYDHRIKQYHSLIEIKLHGRVVVIKETKFYPPGKFNGAYLGLDIDPKQGVEYLQVTKGALRPDSKVVDILPSDGDSAMSTKITVFDDTNAIMTVNNTDMSPVDSYRMFISLPTPDYRYVSSVGINSESDKTRAGSLRGMSFFAGRRIDAAEVDKEAARLREMHGVGTTVSKVNGRYTQNKIEN